MRLICPFPGLSAEEGTPISPDHQIVTGKPETASIDLSSLRIQNIAVCKVVRICLQIPDDLHPDYLLVIAVVVFRAGLANRISFFAFPGKQLHYPAEIPAVSLKNFNNRSLFAGVVVDGAPFSDN